jgi:S-adenosylmethionine decarboxylase
MRQATAIGASGQEWIIEAYGCDEAALRDLVTLRRLFDDIVRALALRPVGKPVWRQFPHTGGVTGLCLLAESHLACHTFPEHQSICLNVFCCQPRPEWDFAGYLRRELGAAQVNVRRMERPYACGAGILAGERASSGLSCSQRKSLPGGRLAGRTPAPRH